MRNIFSPSTSLSYSPFLLRTGLLTMLSLLFLVPTGCKSKKKLAEEAAAQERIAEIERSTQELKDLMATPVSDFEDLAMREERLASIRGKNINDAGVRSLIGQVDRFLQSERERLEREAIPPPPSVDPSQLAADELDKLLGDFTAGLGGERTEREILSRFSSPEAPVLIIIHEGDGLKDYDRPTTISKYLNYLKDQAKSPNEVANVVLDSRGKITELELRKVY